MDCPGLGDQHHPESDGGDPEVWNSRAIMGAGRTNEEAENKTS